MCNQAQAPSSCEQNWDVETKCPGEFSNLAKFNELSQRYTSKPICRRRQLQSAARKRIRRGVEEVLWSTVSHLRSRFEYFVLFGADTRSVWTSFRFRVPSVFALVFGLALAVVLAFLASIFWWFVSLGICARGTALWGGRASGFSCLQSWFQVTLRISFLRPSLPRVWAGERELAVVLPSVLFFFGQATESFLMTATYFFSGGPG